MSPVLQVDAIQRLRAGVVDKVFLEFERPEGLPSAPAAGSASDGGSAPAVSYALLWSLPWHGEGGADSRADAAAAAPAPLVVSAAAESEARVPDWAKGIFSLRFGGPEFKQRHAGTPQPGTVQQQQERSGSAEEQAASMQQQAQAVDQRAQAPAAGDAAFRAAAEAALREGEEAPEDAEFSPCAEPAQPTSYQAVAWVTGEAALAMEAASDAEVLGALRQLGDIFPQLQLPPGASWDRVTLRRTRWGSDPLFKGSYSYLGPDSSPGDVAALAAPVCASSSDVGASVEGSSGSNHSGDTSSSSRAAPPVLLFAGEACHVVHIGTMHGAYLTGQQAAENLLRHWEYQQGQLRAQQRLQQQQIHQQKE